MFQSRSASGFTLLETAIYLTILGLFTVIAIESYRHYTDVQIINENRAKKNQVRIALSNFVAENQRFPCPARPNLPHTHPLSGTEKCITAPIGSCNGLLCSVAGNRDAKWPSNLFLPDADEDPDPIITGGTIPYKALGISFDDTIDPWGGRLSYTVSHYMTNSALFNYDTGVIGYEGWRLVSNSPKVWNWETAKRAPTGSGAPAEDAFLFAIVSHGPDNKGAYNYSGNLIAPCTGTAKDIENCDGDADFINADWNSPIYSLGDNSEYFDDGFSLFTISQESDKWQYASVNEMKNKSGGKVGIGETSPQAPLHIKGNLKADDGFANEFCSENNNCFDPNHIGGPDGIAFKCDAGLMRGIADDDIICTNEIGTSNITPATCSSGFFVTGFDAAGNVICGN